MGTAPKRLMLLIREGKKFPLPLLHSVNAPLSWFTLTAATATETLYFSAVAITITIGHRTHLMTMSLPLPLLQVSL